MGSELDARHHVAEQKVAGGPRSVAGPRADGMLQVAKAWEVFNATRVVVGREYWTRPSRFKVQAERSRAPAGDYT